MTSLRRLIVLSTVLSLAFLPAAGQQPPKREIRAAWLVTIFNLGWPSSSGLTPEQQREELTTLLDRVREAGINAVFFSIRPECDAFYQSSIEPWSYWLTGSQGSPPVPFYDPLEFAIAEAHKRGIEMHAWMNPYRAVLAGASYSRAANHPSQAHPDWLITIGEASILDPGKSVVRAYTLRVIADVACRYDIDGVIMDDYFYLEGTTTEDSATFATENRGFTDLGDWRRDNVNILIRSIRDTLSAIKPWLKFGMSPAGIWKNGVPPGVSGWDPYSVIYCDAVAWLQGKYIDYISPQLYSAVGLNPNYALLEPWWATQLNGRLYWPSLKAGLGANAIARNIRYNRSLQNTSGYVLLDARTTADDFAGIADTLRNDLNLHPALIPRIPWKDSIAPHPPSGLRYAPLAGTTTPVLQWDLPPTASDGDSASWYAVYRFDHRPAASELNDVQNLLAVEGCRYCLVSKFPLLAGPMYFTVTALDRNFNESDTSEVLMIRALPPPTPLLAFPQDSATAMPESLRISWHTAASAVRYHLQVGTDPGFGSGLLVNDSSMIDTARVVANPAGKTTYYWRVRAGNLAGFGDYAEPYSYTTGTPGPVVLVYPPAATPGIPNSLTFVWKKASGATSYRVQIALYSNFTMMVKDTMHLPDTSLTVKGLALNTIHHWRVKGMNQLGSGLWSAANNFRTSVTGFEIRDGTVPEIFALSQNFPNPFNPSSIIRYGLPTRTHVTLTVFNTLGQEVGLLVNGEKDAGYHEVNFDASGLSSGVYLYRMHAGSYVETKKLLLTR